MKYTGARCIHVVLALFVLAASVAPACSGSEKCSMPCCRNTANPVSRPADAAHSMPCCPQTADASAGLGSGCRFDQHRLALPSGGETGPIIAAATAAVDLHPPLRLCASAPAACAMDSSPPDTPLYLRFQTLVI